MRPVDHNQLHKGESDVPIGVRDEVFCFDSIALLPCIAMETPDLMSSRTYLGPILSPYTKIIKNTTNGMFGLSNYR